MTEVDWVEAAAQSGVVGFMHPAELQVLVDLATGRDVLEVGSYKGLSAWCMAHTAKSLLCVDTFRAMTNGQAQGTDLSTYDDFRKATEGFGNVTAFIGTSEDAEKCPEWKRARFGLIFLDAMHDYESTRDDIKRWWPRLRKGGVMAIHDYGHDHFGGVKQAADEVFGPCKEWTVTLRVIQKP